MKALLFIFIFQVTILSLHAQKVNKKFIDEKVKVYDTLLHVKQAKIYIINGILFDGQDSIKIDLALCAYDSNHLVEVNFASCQQMNLPHCDADIVIVLFASHQKVKTKRHLLKKAIESFTENNLSFSEKTLSKSKKPLLYIDNKLIPSLDANKKINSLKLKRVYYIDYNENHILDNIHNGLNLNNGIIRIWTIAK